MGDLHHMGNVDSCHLSSAVNWQRSIRVKERDGAHGKVEGVNLENNWEE